jgi:hypothetical protein
LPLGCFLAGPFLFRLFQCFEKFTHKIYSQTSY